MAGAGVRPGASPANASVLDVAPTLLYLMGLPVARDMEGRILTEILDPAFARENPLTFIPELREPGRDPGRAGRPARRAAPAARGAPVRRALVLFDIDGTLFSAGGVSARALEAALVDTRRDPPPASRASWPPRPGLRAILGWRALSPGARSG